MVADAKKFKLDNIVFIFVTMIVVILLLTDPEISTAIETVGKQGGPLSPFVTGAAYSLSVTAPAATVVIFFLGKVFNPLLIALVGALGTAFTDILLFIFLRKRASESIDYLIRKLKPSKKLTKTVKLLAAIVAGLIIASPLPDELGVAIFGAIGMQTKRLFLYSYILNFFGIFSIAWLGSVL